MNFLTDQDVYAATVRHLREAGHDVATASSLGLAAADDEHLLDVASQKERLLVTRDRDFGALVFVRKMEAGVLYLRIQPSTLNAVHDERMRVLRKHEETALRRAFVVVEPGRHRFRDTGA
ncbi:MAG: hypothetical protein BRD44_04965 [Bacteroidetes bacterium QS_7_67_15]|nr:MAG: hypothetical protein BRD44_04965 [Bacteroidetes bacterium QS_7_67_15]